MPLKTYCFRLYEEDAKYLKKAIELNKSELNKNVSQSEIIRQAIYKYFTDLCNEIELNKRGV